MSHETFDYAGSYDDLSSTDYQSTSVEPITDTNFAEGSLLEGDYFRGEIVVTEDPNIDLGVDGGSDGVTTLDDAGVTVNPDVEEATTALQEGGLDAFSQQLIFGTTEEGFIRKDAEEALGNAAPDIAVGGGILVLVVLAIIALVSAAKGAGRGLTS